jgi:hypothetical protein
LRLKKIKKDGDRRLAGEWREWSLAAASRKQRKKIVE